MHTFHALQNYHLPATSGGGGDGDDANIIVRGNAKKKGDADYVGNADYVDDGDYGENTDEVANGVAAGSRTGGGRGRRNPRRRQ